jgi:hypothetical protein
MKQINQTNKKDNKNKENNMHKQMTCKTKTKPVINWKRNKPNKQSKTRQIRKQGHM